MIRLPSAVSARALCAATWVALVFAGCDCASSLPRAGEVFRSRNVECRTGSCSTTTVVGMLVPPPSEVRDAIVDNGPGLPSTVSRATYEGLLATTRVEIEGPLTAAAGPFAVRLRTSFGERSEELKVHAYFPPIPNLALFGDATPVRPTLRVSRVVDRRGGELLDVDSPFRDPEFDKLSLDVEPPPGAMGTALDATLTVRGLDLPGTPGLMQAARGVHLVRAVGLTEVAEVAGEIRAWLPVDVEVISLSPGQWSHEGSGLDLEVELREEGESVRLTMRGDTSRFAGVVVLDADGQVMPSSSFGWSFPLEGSEGPARFTSDHDEPVSEVKVAIARELLELRHPFVIERASPTDGR